MTTERGALVRKLGRSMPLGEDLLAALVGFEAQRRPVAARIELVHEREPGHRACTLRQGWAPCQKLLPDGGRQVIDLRVPGDFLGLRSALRRTSDHS